MSIWHIQHQYINLIQFKDMVGVVQSLLIMIGINHHSKDIISIHLRIKHIILMNLSGNLINNQ